MLQELERFERDKKFATRPQDWPMWPLLPLKKIKGKFQDPDYVGFLTNVKGPPFTVYIGMMYQLKSGPLSEATKGIPTETFQSVEELMTVWQVD